MELLYYFKPAQLFRPNVSARPNGDLRGSQRGRGSPPEDELILEAPVNEP